MSEEKTSMSGFVRSVAGALTATLAPKGQPSNQPERARNMESKAVDLLLHSGTLEHYKDDRPAEEVLIESLDRAAIRFACLLDDDTRDDAGNFLITLDQRLDIFKMARDWVAVRRRTQIGDQQGDQRGVRDMQDRIQTGRAQPTAKPDPNKRRPGRPTNAEVAARKEAQLKQQENDDSGWQTKLANANANGGAT